MKSKYLIFILIFMMFLITGCSNNLEVIDDTPTQEDDTPVVEDEDPNNNEEEDVVENISCSESTELVTLDNTSTLDAEFLWNNSVSCEGLELVDGIIKYKEGLTEASLTTSIFSIEQFDEFVPSWNIIIDSDIKVRIKVSVGNSDGMSEEFLMGYWTLGYKTSLSNQTSDYAKVYIDTIVAQDISLDRVSFTITFDEGAFSLQNISLTTIPTGSIWLFDETKLVEYNINVPTKQQLSIPDIGSSICSPTSLSMILAYYGENLPPSDVAEFVRDKGSQIYGNWSFNTSYAGGYENLFSRVEYINDFDTILSYLSQDIPLAFSIKTSSAASLEGAIMAYPAGHLVVLRGLKYENDIWYALVNDPAEYTDEAVLRQYVLSELLDAWNGYTYVVTNQEFE